MIKFSKWMYELGYNTAIKHVLSVIDGIPNNKPTVEDFKARARDEDHFHRKMKDAMVVYEERRALKDHVHALIDPDYKPKVTDLAMLMFGDDDGVQ